MGNVKEHQGVDYFVDPRPLTKEEKKQISEANEYYKLTRIKMPTSKNASSKRTPRKKKTSVS